MLFRLTKKLATKVKTGPLTNGGLENNLLADWSANLFTANRQLQIILCNTRSLYCCLMAGKGITTESKFASAAMMTIGKSLSEDGLTDIFEKFVRPECTETRFKKSLNRSVTGSMNDLIFGAKVYLDERMDLDEIARRLNQTPLSTLVDDKGRNYNNPNEAIRLLVKQS